MTEVIAIEDILILDNRQRKHFPEAEMEELRESILNDENGLFSPILVRPSNKKTKPYILVAGERRLRTVKTIEEEYRHGEQLVPPGYIPAVVRYFSSDISAQEAELHENIIRLGLTWQEKAEAITALHKLKLSKNPKHTKGNTALLLEDNPDPEQSEPRLAVRREVNNALLVSNYLDDPEVQKARDMREASKIVSRKMEAEALERLKKLREEKVALQAEQPTPEQTEEDNTNLDLGIQEVKPIGQLLEGDVRVKLPEIKDGSVNVVLTDPPYGMNADKFNDGGKGTQKHDYEDSAEYALELYEFVIKELDRVCAANAHVYLFCDIQHFFTIRSMFSKGWTVRRRPLVWNRGTAGKLVDGLSTGWRSSGEYIISARRGDRQYSGVKSEIINIADTKHKNHAAEKPKELYKYLLEMSAVPGDTVLDAFAGSGVIFPACRELLLSPIAIEINERFIELCYLAQVDKLDIMSEEKDEEPGGLDGLL